MTDISYWKDYASRLEDFISHYQKEIQKTSIENINYDIEVVLFNEKIASLYGELNRIKSVISVLRYKYDTDEI